MKILVIGSKGMLGHELIKVFSDHEVFAWDLRELDITKDDQVEEKITDLKPDIVINTAAYNDVDGCEEKKDLCNLLNGLAVGYIARVCQKIGAIFIQYSSDYVFKGDKEEGYKEDDQPDPQSAYAKSKFLGEEELRKKCEKHYLIRTSRLFGKPAISKTAKKSFVDKILEVAKEKDELEIVDEEYSSPTYAADLAKRTRKIIDGQNSWGIYHATNEGACTWYEFAQEIFKISGVKKKLIPVSGGKFSRPAARPRYSRLLNTKLSPMCSWQQALKEYLNQIS